MKRLLVVDDALFMRKLIRGIAAEAGWEVVGEAGNGAEAITLYQQHQPDLVTMDLVMPVMGGLEALRQIRAIDPQAKVVVVTALDQKQALMDSIHDGAIDFIVKPFERQRVLNLLAKLGGEAPRATPGSN
jgi:two-component system chemotaxis response regulator CheY